MNLRHRDFCRRASPVLRYLILPSLRFIFRYRTNYLRLSLSLSDLWRMYIIELTGTIPENVLRFLNNYQREDRERERESKANTSIVKKNF